MRSPEWINEGLTYLKNNRGLIEKYDSGGLADYDKVITQLQELKQDAGGLLWVTVNVKPEVPYAQLSKSVDKLVTKKWITSYAYAYEFRKADQQNCGLHVHIALPRGTKRPSEADREIRNTFKHLVGDSARHIDVKIYDLKLLNDKIDYLNGIKDDPQKEESIAFTKQKRIELGINNIYTYNI